MHLHHTYIAMNSTFDTNMCDCTYLNSWKVGIFCLKSNKLKSNPQLQTSWWWFYMQLLFHIHSPWWNANIWEPEQADVPWSCHHCCPAGRNCLGGLWFRCELDDTWVTENNEEDLSCCCFFLFFFTYNQAPSSSGGFGYHYFPLQNPFGRSAILYN